MQRAGGAWAAGRLRAGAIASALAVAAVLVGPLAVADTTAATSAASAETANGPAHPPPPANADVDYQIGGAYRPAPGVRVVDRDRTARPAAGRYNICYVNAFQTQAHQDGWWKRHHRSLLLRDGAGRLVEDPGWPGEILLDTSTVAMRRQLSRIVGGWIDGCARKGFAAVEPDNLDSDTRSRHLLTRADNLAFARLLARRAHGDGLAIAQKNDAGLTRADRRRVGFDFAIAEECQVYSECGRYLWTYGDHVIEIEYSDNGRRFYRAACRARGARISVLLRDRDVVPHGHRHYVSEDC